MGLYFQAKVLLALESAFDGHSVPNSLLHRIDTLDKAFHFYSTPVDPRLVHINIELALLIILGYWSILNVNLPA